MTIPSTYIAGKTFVDDWLGDLTYALDLSAATGTFRLNVITEVETGTPTVDPESSTAPWGSDPWGAGASHWNEVNWNGTYGTATNHIELAASPVLSLTGPPRRIVWQDNNASILWTGMTGTLDNGAGMLLSQYVSSAFRRPMAFYNFGGAFPVANGEFEVTWDPTLGIMAWNY